MAVQGHNSVRILNKGRYVTGPWTTWRFFIVIYQFPQETGFVQKWNIHEYTCSTEKNMAIFMGKTDEVSTCFFSRIQWIPV